MKKCAPTGQNKCQAISRHKGKQMDGIGMAIPHVSLRPIFCRIYHYPRNIAAYIVMLLFLPCFARKYNFAISM
jgi:hypothetical protein